MKNKIKLTIFIMISFGLISCTEDSQKNTPQPPAPQPPPVQASLPPKVPDDGIRIKGFIDGVDLKGNASGWTFDKKALDKPVIVKFYVDDPVGKDPKKFVGQTTANLPRPDVEKALNVSGKFGFLYHLPIKFNDSVIHKLYVFGVASSEVPGITLLPGSPNLFKINKK